MAALDTSRTSYGANRQPSRLGTIFTMIAANVMHWNKARITRKTLSALNDRELADIGLRRDDIENIAIGRPQN